MENNFSEEIESFLSHKMTSTEKDVFLSQMESNPELKEQVQFQKDIINGIQVYRKEELKNRLVQIPVVGTETILQSLTTLKTAGIAAISTGVVITAVLFYNANNQQSVTNEKNISENNPMAVEEETSPEKEQPVELLEKAANSSIESSGENASESTEEQQVLSKGTTVKTESEEKQVNVSIQETEPAEEIAPLEPDLIDNFDESDNLPKVSSIGKKDITNISTKGETSIAVEKIDDGIHNFHYKYFNNKLYLYGSFGQSMYEHIEVNPDNQKRLFLSYNNNYFEIKDNQKNITRLREIVDASIKAKLDSIRE